MSGVHDDLATLGDVCPVCGSGLLNGEHIANYPCALRELVNERDRMEEKNTKLSALIVEQEDEYRKERRAAEAEIARLREESEENFSALMDERDKAVAAEARCARLQQALGELLPYAQLDDPWSNGIENYRWLLAQAREALAGLDMPAGKTPPPRDPGKQGVW